MNRIQRMLRGTGVLGVTLCSVLLLHVSNANADSATSLLSGFDQARIESVYPISDEESLGELAKMIYRLKSVDSTTLAGKVSQSSHVEVGDAVEVAGQIQAIRLLAIPTRLVEFLEFSKLQQLTIHDEAGRTIQILTLPLPSETKVGDRVRGVGVTIGIDSEDRDASAGRASAVTCSHLSWYPNESAKVGWRMLRQASVDISLLSELGSRNRRPLLPEDGDAFYSVLAAAAELRSNERLPQPVAIAPVTLLKGSSKLSGEWIRMELETVQITRIAVTEPRRQSQLGSDHYYQIDAVGDLGNVIVKIERADGDDEPPATFQNRYPVSLVVRELPPFLREQIRFQEGGDAILSHVRRQIEIDGFFFRLWGYTTDFMEQHGGGEQFGPLVIAAEIRDNEPSSADVAGVSRIGTIAAVAVLAAIFVIWRWQRSVNARDRWVQQQRKERESDRLQMP